IDELPRLMSSGYNARKHRTIGMRLEFATKDKYANKGIITKNTENKQIFPLRLTDNKKKNINLLYLQDQKINDCAIRLPRRDDRLGSNSTITTGNEYRSSVYADLECVLRKTESIREDTSSCAYQQHEDTRVRDRCHLIFVFHNLSEYDAHFIIKEIATAYDGHVNVLSIIKKKYISFGVFPYEYIDCVEKLQDTRLPRELFFAKNKYIRSNSSSNLMYDVNNLYGWTMCLCHIEFRWIEDAANFRDKPPGKCEDKLLATLYDKQRYVIYYRNLQQCTRHGLRVTKIHRAMIAKPNFHSRRSLNEEIEMTSEQFCGSGTRLIKRLARDYTGINPLNAAYREHNIAYSRSTDRHVAEIARNSALSERPAAATVWTAMKAKTKIGMKPKKKTTKKKATKKRVLQLEEQRHDRAMEQGRGYLATYKRGQGVAAKK
ncbi:hypothetical protein ALC53_04137, partial [Atta colombica]